MNTYGQRRAWHEETSSFGSMHKSAGDAKLCITSPAAILGEFATSNRYMTYVLVDRTVASPINQIPLEPTESIAQAVMETRRLSGFTWEELGDLFGVSRRSVHLWVNGGSVSSGNDRLVRRMLAVFRNIDRGTQAETRSMLLAIDSNNQMSIFDLLKARRFVEVIVRAEMVKISKSIRLPSSQSAKSNRPPPPALLLGAEQERLGTAVGKARKARPRRVSDTAG